MSRTVTSTTLDAVLAIIAQSGEFATAQRVADAMQPRVPVRRMRGWLDILVHQQRAVRTGLSTATRYRVVDVAAAERGARDLGRRSRSASTVTESDLPAIQVQLRRPVDDRPVVTYSRQRLDAYWPNQTLLLPSEVSARLVTSLRRTAPMVAPSAAPGSVGIAPDLKAATLALSAAAQSVARGIGLRSRLRGRVYRPAIAASVFERPAVAEAGGDARRLWNHRAAIERMMSSGTPVLDWGTALAVYLALTQPTPRRPGDSAAAAHRPRRPPFIRTERLTLTGTAFEPAADAALLAACLRQIMVFAGAISDPIEQAFYVYAHVLLLLPFGAENLSMAALLANIPLLRAGLRPTPFVANFDRDMLGALVAWWEFSRPELLAEVVARSAESMGSNVGIPRSAGR